MIHIIDLHYLKRAHVIASFLLETRAGPVLVETGPHATLPMLRKGIHRLGYGLKEIRHVFLTHIHLDHAGAAWALAEQGATIYVHPKGARHLASPERLMRSAKRIYGAQMDKLWGSMEPIPESKLQVVEHGQSIEVGETTLTSWHTPGHATHHIAWQCGNALFAGDIAGVCIDGSIVVPPCPPPDINIEHWQDSIALIRELDLVEEIYLTHFGQAPDVGDHLSQLEKHLWDWADWIRPMWEQEMDVEEITPRFQAYVEGEMIALGMSKKEIIQYETANPSWMSVAGLMRYWSTRNAPTEPKS